MVFFTTMKFEYSFSDRNNFFFSERILVTRGNKLIFKERLLSTVKICRMSIGWRELSKFRLSNLKMSIRQFKMSRSSTNSLPCVGLRTRGQGKQALFFSLVNVFPSILIYKDYYFIRKLMVKCVYSCEQREFQIPHQYFFYLINFILFLNFTILYQFCPTSK